MFQMFVDHICDKIIRNVYVYLEYEWICDDVLYW